MGLLLKFPPHYECDAETIFVQQSDDAQPESELKIWLGKSPILDGNMELGLHSPNKNGNNYMRACNGECCRVVHKP